LLLHLLKVLDLPHYLLLNSSLLIKTVRVAYSFDFSILKRKIKI